MNHILNYSLFLKESKDENDVDKDRTGPDYKIYQMTHDEGEQQKDCWVDWLVVLRP